MEIKFVISDPQTGRSYPKTHQADLTGRKIGDKIRGDEIGLNGFELEITGGSDTAGFPMRKDIVIPGRKSALLSSGTGLRKKPHKGAKIRKTVRGGIISSFTAQVNLKVVSGKELAKALGVEEKKEEVKKEEKKE